jgi:beta-galactosidase
MQGAYQGFYDANIQVDWVHVDHIDEYNLLYLPYPVMLTRRTADRLRGWVAVGGTLIAEGCPAYFADGGRAGTVQPNLGLDEVFGARERYVEFTPDLLGDLRFNLDGTPAWGGLFLQAYEPTTGIPVGWYEDGRVAAIDHTYGKGKTRLIGTMAGAGYAAHAGDRTPAPFMRLLTFGGVGQHVTCSDPHVKARLHDGPGGTYLWVANPTRRPRYARLTLSTAWGPFSSGQTLWGGGAEVDGRTIALTVGARDVSVIALDSVDANAI